MKRSFLALALAQAFCTSTASAGKATALPSSSQLTIAIPRFGNISMAPGTANGQFVASIGDMGKVTLSGTFAQVGTFRMCGQSNASHKPFAGATGVLAALAKLSIGTPTICIQRLKEGQTAELTFEGDLSAGGAGVHLTGRVTDDNAGPQYVVYGTANGDWDLRDLHPALNKNSLTQQLALSGTEFVITSVPLVDPTWRELSPGLHVKGAISLTAEAQKASDVARAIAAARVLAPGTQSSNSVPAHITVTAGRLQVDAGIPGNVKLKPPFAMAGNASWNIGLTKTSVDIGATLPISYKFASQTAPTVFVGQLAYKAPQTFQGALTATGGMTFKNVSFDNVTMQVGLDAATFGTTGLPSSLGFRARAHWAGTTWELAGVGGADPSEVLFTGAVTDASFDTVLTKLPFPAQLRSAVPPFMKQIKVRKGEVYFAPANIRLGERTYGQGIGFQADMDGPLGCRAVVRAYWEAGGDVRARLVWEGFSRDQIAAEISRAINAKKVGISTSDIKDLLSQIALDTIIVEVIQPAGSSTPLVQGRWLVSIKGAKQSGTFGVGTSVGEAVTSAIVGMVKEWTDRKTKKLL